ncbi:MAG: acyltransferase [Xanthobacteraceae bacterium]
MSKTSLALNNLRGYAILIVLAFHSSIAYVVHQPAAALPFDQPPYGWMANPIVDSNRWLGFDLFCAFTFLYMMHLMFFLSGLFIWPSLKRKGAGAFLSDRFMRLGVPFVFGVYLLMPVAYFAVYRQTAIDPDWPAYLSHLLALPFWPSGPLWFLWVLLALNGAAAVLFRFAPGLVEAAARFAERSNPTRLFFALTAISALVGLLLCIFFTPWQWINLGPLAFQPFLLPQYAIFFLFGLAAGARGLERGLFAAEHRLADHWGRWLAIALASFALWIAFAALTVGGAAIPGLQIGSVLAQATFAASACLAAAAIFRRFAARPWPILDSISENAYGIYLFHYLFVLWSQYLLLGVEMPAIVKAALVFGAALSLSWAATAAICSVPLGARIMRGQRRTAMAVAHAPAEQRAVEPSQH